MSVAFPVNMPPSAKMVLYTLVRKLCYSSISAIIDFVAVNYSHTRKFSLTAWGHLQMVGVFGILTAPTFSLQVFCIVNVSNCLVYKCRFH